MTAKRLHPGPASYLAFTIGSFGMALLVSGWRTVIAAAFSAMLALLFYPDSLRALFRPRVLAALALLGLGGALTDGGWALGVQMGLRAFTILVALGGLATHVGVMDLLKLLGGERLAPLGFAVGVAINALPSLSRSLVTTSEALRMRGGWRRPLHAAQLFLTTVLVNLLRYGDQVVAAAESRAFNPAHIHTTASPTIARFEWPIIGGMMLAVLALWCL